MNRTCACLPIMVMMLVVASEAQVSGNMSQAPASSTVAGVVIKDPGSEPVKKAIIELIAEDQQQGGNYTIVTGVDGTFRIEGVAPGRYHLFAERTGYVESTNRSGRSRGRALTVVPGRDLKDLQVRLAASATVTGRVSDEDGEPLQNAEVTVLHRTFSSGRAHWQQVSSERTNDLGEYRVSGLAAGNYYVSVNPPPDFKSLLDSENYSVAGKQNSSRSSEKPSSSYQTEYYPGTFDRSQAEPIELRAGEEFPANFSLSPVPTLTIRGMVSNLPPRSSATVMLQSNDFNVIFNGAEVHKDGSFVIHDVSPGTYTIVASVDGAPVPMMARQSLQLTSSNLDGVRLVPQTGATIRGRLHLEGKTDEGSMAASHLVVWLHSADAEEDAVMDLSVGNGFSPMAAIGSDGSFQWTNVPPGTYSVLIGDERSGGTDWFIKSVVASGRATDTSAIAVEGGAISLEVIASANGGIVQGIVLDSQGQPVSDAVVVAAPEAAMRSHSDRYRRTASDQSGHFMIRGIVPGQYSLFAWDDIDGDAFYDPEFLKTFEPQSSSLRIVEGEHKGVELRVITTGEQP